MNTFPILDGRLQSDLDCQGFNLVNLGSGSPSGLLGNRLVVTDPAGVLLTLGGVTDIEAAYLDGVTSSIQVQLDAKLALAGGTMTGPILLSGAPTLANHAVTKTYADAIAAGIQPKQSVAAATTANITLSGAQTIDAVSIVATRRVLVKDQTVASQNGIYEAQTGAWNRAPDANTDAEVTAGMYCFVEEGTANGDQGFVLVTNNPIILDTTALVFSPFTGAATTTSSLGVLKVGNDFRLDPSYSATFAALNLSALTASRAIVTDASKNLVSATVTATELGYLAGVTSALQTQLNARLLLAGGTLTGPLLLAGDPTIALHAATKGYVDALLGGSTAIHTPVRAATTANITLSGAQTIDVVSVVAGDRVLVKNQSTGSQNGIYVAASGAWARAADMDSSGDLSGGSAVTVSEGSVNGNRLFLLTTNDPMTLGSTALVFAQIPFTLDPADSPTLTGLTVSGLSASTVLVANGSKAITSSAVTPTELGWLTGTTSAIQTQIDSKLNLAGGTLTGPLVLDADPTLALHAATMQYVDAAVTGGVVTASLGVSKVGNDFRLDATYSPTFANLTLTGLTASRVLVTDASKNLVSSSATPTEVDYLAGVTSAIQTQISARFLIAGGTLTGALILAGDPVTALGAATMQYVDAAAAGAGVAFTGSGGVDRVGDDFRLDATYSPTFVALNLSGLTASRALVTDASKNLTSSATSLAELAFLSGVTSAVQTQLGARLLLAGGTLTGALILAADPVTALGAATAQYVDSQIAAIPGGTVYTGSLGVSKVTNDFRLDPTYSATFAALTLSGLTASKALVTNGSKLLTSATATAAEVDFLSGVTSAIQTQIDARLLIAGGTLTGPLILAADPTLAMHAATRQYVLAQVATATIPGIVSTADANALWIDAAEHVGIGTSTPTAMLEIKAQAAVAGTGTISSSGFTVTGVGTAFLTQLHVGDTITASGQTVTISAIASDTSLTTTSTFAPVLSAVGFTFGIPIHKWTNSASALTGFMTSSGDLMLGTPLAGEDGFISSSHTVTNPTAGLRGLTSALLLNAISGAFTSTATGLLATTAVGSTNTQNWTGTTSLIGIQATGSIKSGATGTVAAIVGIQASVSNASAGVTLTSGYVIREQAGSATGIYTNFAGIALLNHTVATNNTNLLIGTTTIPSGNWSINNVSTHPNFFGGTLAIDSLTASRALVTDGSKVLVSSTVTATELGYLSGVTSGIQTQFTGKLSTGGGTLSADLTISTLTASTALVANGSKVITSSATTATELGYLSGVTSALQTQLNAKGYLGLPKNLQPNAYGILASDMGKAIVHASADTTARIYTIPAHATIPISVDDAIFTVINQNAAGVITVAITSDTLRRAGTGATGSVTVPANAMVTFTKVTTTEWIYSGVGI